VGATLAFRFRSRKWKSWRRATSNRFSFARLGCTADDESKERCSGKGEAREGVAALLVDTTTMFHTTRWPTTRGRRAPRWSPYRAGFPLALIEKIKPILILIIANPVNGRQVRFGVPDLVKTAGRLGGFQFSEFCLALQVWWSFRRRVGAWSISDCTAPKPFELSRIRKEGVFEGLPRTFQVGDHSQLPAARRFPASLDRNHGERPRDCVSWGFASGTDLWRPLQFHPESISTAGRPIAGLRAVEERC